MRAKMCVGCRKTMPVDRFYRVRKDSNSRQSRCKSCDNNRRCVTVRKERERQRLRLQTIRATRTSGTGEGEKR